VRAAVLQPAEVLPLDRGASPCDCTTANCLSCQWQL